MDELRHMHLLLIAYSRIWKTACRCGHVLLVRCNMCCGWRAGRTRSCARPIHRDVVWLIRVTRRVWREVLEPFYNLSSVPLPIGPFRFTAVPIKGTRGTSEHLCTHERARPQTLTCDDMYILPRRIVPLSSEDVWPHAQTIIFILNISCFLLHFPVL